MGEVHLFPLSGREVLLDERGVALRVSWHFDQAMVDLSVWRDDRCTDTFQLTIDDASRLITSLVEGLGAAAAVRDPGPEPLPLATRVRGWWRRLAG